MSHYFLLVLIFTLYFCYSLYPDRLSESSKVARNFFCYFKNVGIRPPDIFFKILLATSLLATFSVSLFFLISSLHISRHFFNLLLLLLATFHFPQLVLIFPHYFLNSTSSFIIFIYFFHQNI